MEYQIALSPNIGISPTEFAAAWNASDETHAVAAATLTPSSSTNYDPFLTEVVVTLGTIGVGVVTNAIYDLIKQVIVKQKKHQHVHIQQLDQPDGTHLLVVDIDEE